MIPYKINDEVHKHWKGFASTFKDYYVSFLDSPIKSNSQKKGLASHGEHCLKLIKCSNGSFVKAGDTIVAKGREDEGKLIPIEMLK